MSSRCPRMFSSTATPALEMPILPTMPASVIVSTRWPDGCSIVHRIQRVRIAHRPSSRQSGRRSAVPFAWRCRGRRWWRSRRVRRTGFRPGVERPDQLGRQAAAGRDALDLLGQLGRELADPAQRLAPSASTSRRTGRRQRRRAAGRCRRWPRSAPPGRRPAHGRGRRVWSRWSDARECSCPQA